MALLPAILLITFLSGIGGFLADRFGPRYPMIIGPLIVALGMSLFIFPGSHANYFLAFLPGLILFGLGMSLVIAPLTKSALSVDEKFSGAASGINNAIARVAGLLAVALLGAVMASLFSFHLTKAIPDLHLSSEKQTMIIRQTEKLGGISLPRSFTMPEQNETRQVINAAFVSSFRVAMELNAFLALLSSIIAFFTIHNDKKQREK